MPSVEVAGGVRAQQIVEHTQRGGILACRDQPTREAQLLVDWQNREYVGLAHLAVDGTQFRARVPGANPECAQRRIGERLLVAAEQSHVEIRDRELRIDRILLQ